MRRSTASSSAATSGSSAAVDGLDAGAAVDVDHGRDALAPGRPHPVGEQHVGAGHGPLEDLAGPLGQDHRGHRPELLAALDVVEPLQVGRPGGVGEQAAVPEGARPVLAAALEPGDHPVGGDHLGDRVGQVGRALVGDPGRGQPGGQLVVGPAAPEGGRRHGRDPVAEGVGEVHGRAEGGAGVAGGRLHPDALERPLLGQDRVGHAVERDPAGHGQVAVAGLGVQPADQLEQDLLEAELDAGGQVGVLGGPLLALAAPLGQGVQLDRGDGEAAVAGGPDGLAQLPEVGAAARRRPGPSPCTRPRSAGTRGGR